ncbi:MAG: hypothetical protein HWE07_09005 [Cytophagia bacterium]|nr:hypothetical protein [Cytophagia bacterium]
MDTQVLTAIITSFVALILGIVSLLIQFRLNKKNHLNQLEIEKIRANIELDKLRLSNELNHDSEKQKKFDQAKEQLDDILFEIVTLASGLEKSWQKGTFENSVNEIRLNSLAFSQKILKINHLITPKTLTSVTLKLYNIEETLSKALEEGTGGNLSKILKPIKTEINELRVIILNTSIHKSSAQKD